MSMSCNMCVYVVTKVIVQVLYFISRCYYLYEFFVVFQGVQVVHFVFRFKSIIPGLLICLC